MTAMGNAIHSLADLRLYLLQDIRRAERQMVRALPDLADRARSPALRQALDDHMDEGRTHLARLDEIFDLIGAAPRGMGCPAIEGLLHEAQAMTGGIACPDLMDAALAAAAQAMEHYEITRYGTLIAWSQELGRPEVAEVLSQTLAEEKMADEKLTKLAEGHLNAAA